MFKDRVETIYQAKVEGDKENTLLPDDGLPEKRRILLEMLEGIAEPAEPLSKGDFSLYQMRIKDKCTLCNSCDLFCPTGALERIEDEEMVRIDFRLSYCVGCFQCEELCPEKALYSSNTIDFKSFIKGEKKILCQKKKVICSECESPYLPIDRVDTCLSCRKKKDMEKGFFEMMGIGDYRNE